MDFFNNKPWLVHGTGSLLLLVGITCGSSAFSAQPSLSDVFRTRLACEVVKPLLADMVVEPVYTRSAGDCISVLPDDSNTAYFSDDSCESTLNFKETTLTSHCELLLDPDELGEGQGIESPTAWTLPPGARLDLGARSLEGVTQPYMQRHIYRRVQTAAGECELEMRVYAPSPTHDGPERPSLLALHGGSWSSRGFGFFGLELSIPHYVDQGFVVYAPFYRLLGDSEGSAACQNATIDQVIDDASGALAWVRENAADYGSSPKPAVFGQSAGAHLAASLAVNESESVTSAVLFYPPTDFTDFTLRAQQGFYTDDQGLEILERVLGVNMDAVNVSASPIPENSFPQRIVESDINVPPMFMVHGMQDSLVEARQSVRLCEALSGEELTSTDSEIASLDTYREVRQCGAESSLHLIKEGNHALDVCLVGILVSTDLCPSGSELSRREVSTAIREAVSFAKQYSSVVDDPETGEGESGDGTEPSTEPGQDGNDGEQDDGQDNSSDDDSGSGGTGWFLLAIGVVGLLLRGSKRLSSHRA